MLNRRRFVYGLLSMGGLGLSGGSNAAQTPSLHGRLSRDVFLALREQTFTTLIGGRRVPLVLASVSDDGCRPAREQFTVVFRGPRDLQPTDGPCTLRHPKAGMTHLYVQPGGVDDRSSYVRASFNLTTS